MSDFKNEKYYYFPDDLERYPDAWCYIVWSRRGPGKTYSALRENAKMAGRQLSAGEYTKRAVSRALADRNERGRSEDSVIS